MIKGLAEQRDYAWTAAQEAWIEGKLPEAYHYCHAALARGQDKSAVHALMASIAIALGRLEQAQDYLRLAREQTPAPSAGGARYLMIQPWGCGFWGEVLNTVAQLAFAEIEGRIPVVWWGEGCLYGVPGLANAWEAYFRPVNGQLMPELEKAGRTYAPAHWNAGNLRSTSASRVVGPERRVSSLLLLGSEADVAVADCHTRLQEILPWAPAGHWLAGLPTEVAYRELFRRYVRPVEAIERQVEELAAQYFVRRPLLAVHFRTQSPIKNIESAEQRPLTIADYLPEVDAFLQVNPDGGVFLLTDFAEAVAAFAERYPGKVLVLPAVRLDRAEDVEVTFLDGQDRSRLAREVMRDVFLSLRCDAFLGDGASGVSCVVGHLKDWGATRRLLRQDVTLMAGWTKFEPRADGGRTSSGSGGDG